MRNYTVCNFLRFTIIIVYGLRRTCFMCMRRFTQNANYGFLEFPYDHTTFKFVLLHLHIFYLFSFIHMSTVPVNNIAWNSSVADHLLRAIITTGAHLNAKKLNEAALSFFSSKPHLMDFYRSNEENAIRRLKEMYSDEQKRIYQTMGWRDYNQRNHFYFIYS